MDCRHLVLLWRETGRYELMQCAACGQFMKFEKHYKEATGNP